tara:strand:+ start:235 stop:465 length:231 start_codon:yes stop_codon:yes gene_type:complete
LQDSWVTGDSVDIRMPFHTIGPAPIQMGIDHTVRRNIRIVGQNRVDRAGQSGYILFGKTKRFWDDISIPRIGISFK